MATDNISDAIDALTAEEETGAPADPVVTEPVTPADPPVEEPAEPADPEAEPQGEAVEDSLAEEAISHYGLSQEEVDQAGDLLPWVLARMDKQASQLMQRQMEPEPESPPTQPAAEPAPKREPITDLAKFELKINRDDYDEGTLSVFDAVTEQINKDRSTINQHREVIQIMAEALRETHHTASELKSRTESVSSAEYGDTMDAFFANLPDEYADIYGKEPMSRLTHNSPKVAARHALEKEMNILAQFDANGGRTLRGTKEQAIRTLRALHADKAHVVARREVDKELKTHTRRGIARPSGRSIKKSNDPLVRRQNAMSAIEKHLSKLGI